MFGKKKLYKITYKVHFTSNITVIAAKNEAQAISKCYKIAKKRYYIIPDILSIQEVTT